MDWVGFEPPICCSVMRSPAPVRPSIHYVKAGKRGISTPLISAVLRAVAPFQTSCALHASLFLKSPKSSAPRSTNRCSLRQQRANRSSPSCQSFFQKDDTSGRIRTCSTCLRFHRSEIVVLLVSSDQPHKKRGRFPRMPLNENWWRLESHWNHEAPTNTRKVSLKLSRHPDDILVYQSGAV